MESNLPESFLWLLKYFSAMTNLSKYDLFTEVMFLEELILKQDPYFFGTLHKFKAEDQQPHVGIRLSRKNPIPHDPNKIKSQRVREPPAYVGRKPKPSS